MARSRLVRALPAFLGIALLTVPVAGQGVPRLDSYNGVAVRILQSNNAGNIHHIIDPATNQITGIIRGCPHAHNLTVHPDGLYYYCSNEQEYTVDVFDTRTLQRVTQIPRADRKPLLAPRLIAADLDDPLSRRPAQELAPALRGDL